MIRKIDDLAVAVKEGLDETTARMKEGFDETSDGLNEVKEGLAKVEARLDRVAESLQERLMCLRNLQAPNYPYPDLVVVKEVETQGKKSLLSKVRGVGVKDMTLHFLCPVDMSTVPCGMNGEGYRFRETRGWIKKLSPVMQVRQCGMYSIAPGQSKSKALWFRCVCPYCICFLALASRIGVLCRTWLIATQGNCERVFL